MHLVLESIKDCVTLRRRFLGLKLGRKFMLKMKGGTLIVSDN